MSERFWELLLTLAILLFLAVVIALPILNLKYGLTCLAVK